MNPLSKNTLREVLRSPGRFLAIVAIIALGSGFFVGLRVSQKAMISTADTYFDKTSFFDFSVSTTLGLTQDDAVAFAGHPDIADAEGGFKLDALVNIGGSTDYVYALYSLPERVNNPDVLEGRLPESPDECLADSRSGLRPGDRVTISDNNDEDTLELVTERSFTVTGISTSPLYLNFERGSTSLGTGSVSAFIYVLPQVFDADYYTGVYLRCTDMPPAYTDEYEDRSKALESNLTALAEERAEIRYNSIFSDARSELDDGWAEYNDAYEEYKTERDDAEKELNDAKDELDNAKAELDDAARQIEDGLAELDDGEKELADSWQTLVDAKTELDSAKSELDSSRDEIGDGWAEYYDGLAQLETERADAQRKIADGEAELSDALAELEEGEGEYEENLALYNDGKAQYDEGLKALNDSESLLEDGEREYDSGMAQYRAGLSQYEDAMEQLNAAKAVLDASKAELEEAQEKFDDLMEQLVAGINEALAGMGLPVHYESAEDLLTALENGDYIATLAVNTALRQAAETYPDADIPADSAALLAYRDTLSSGWSEYNAGLAQYEENAAYLDVLESELSSAGDVLAASRRQLDDGWAELEEGRRTLEASGVELEEARKQLEDGRAQLDQGWSEYNDGVAELENAKAELADAMDNAEAELGNARVRLEDAQRQYDEGLEEYEQGLADYREGLDKYSEGRTKLNSARTELEDSQREYSDGLSDYEDGLVEYADARSEADRAFAEAEAELADARSELEDAERELEELEHPETYVLGRWSNVGYSCFESDSSIVRSISSVFPVFFFLVAALICITTVTRMVEEQRSQLGVLMALGYSTTAMMGKFLIYSGLATVIGGVTGILLGSRLIPLVVWQAYKIMYSFSDKIEFYYDFTLSTVTFALYLAAMLLVTYLACRREISDVPANVIRPRAPKAGKRVILERLPFIWKRLGFLWKVTVRNIFRYKLRVIMMILGVAGCTALMLTGMGINDSIKNVVDYQFNEISLYDYTVTFTEPLSGEGEAQFLAQAGDYADDALFLHQSSYTASFNRTQKDVELSVVESNQIDAIGEFVDFHSGSKKLPFPDDGQVLVTAGLADALNIYTGDTLELRSDDAPAMSLTVSGIYDNYIYNYVYISSDTYKSACGEDPEINFAMVVKSDGVDTGQALASLLSIDNVLTASASLDMRERISNMMDSLIYIVLLTVICAAALAFVVIYNLTNINIQERLRELATVKVLGFYDAESALYVLRENVILTVLGAAAGVPLGLALNAFVVSRVDIDLVRFTPRVLPMSYVYSILLTFLFSILVDLVMSHRLTKIDPASALKSAE